MKGGKIILSQLLQLCFGTDNTHFCHKAAAVRDVAHAFISAVLSIRDGCFISIRIVSHFKVFALVEFL